MLSQNHMGPHFDIGSGLPQLPMSAPPIRTRNTSSSSTSSLSNAETQFPFHLLSQLTGSMDLHSGVATTVVNPAMLGFGQVNTRLDRSLSMSECSTAQQQNKINAASQQNKNMVNPSRYKTEVCRPFNENGFCKYGEKCQFAHGDHELKSLPRHPKYKTELCRTFHTVGFCPYGPRCHFIHSEDEYKLVEISQMKQQHAAQQAAQEMAQQAAQLQAQQQALQVQLKTLFSQVQQQLANQMVVQSVNQPPPVTCGSVNFNSSGRPKLYHSTSVHPLMNVGCVQVLDSCSSNNANTPREHLGSAGDIPSDSSASGSPVHSPVFSDDTVSEMSLSDSLSLSGGTGPHGFVTSPVSSADSSFNFSSSSSTGELSPLQMSPVKMQQQQQSQQHPYHPQPMYPDSIAQLAARVQELSMCNNNSTDNIQQQQENHQLNSSSHSSSPPDYNSDTEAHCRLPVFSNLAQQTR